MTRSTRLTALDSLRGFGILLVVLGHTSQSAGLIHWIFSFHMPLFFIISGMLFHERQFLDSVKKKAVRLLVPYLFFGTITLAYWALIERRLRGSNVSVTNALANIPLARAGVDDYPQNAVLWFLPCLFVTEMLFLGVFTFVKSKKFVRHDWTVAATLAVISFLSIMVMHSFDLPIEQFRLPWTLDIVPFSMLFYCIGYLLSRFLMPFMQKARLQTLLRVVYAAIGVAGLCLLWAFDELTGLSVNLNGASTSNPFWMLCAALLGFISSLMLCIAIDCRLLQFLGRVSLTIMCVHEPVKRALIFAMAKILGMNTDALRANLACAMLVAVVTVAICVAVHLVMDRFAPVLIGNSRHNPVSQDKAVQK
ncbi:acyltransferase family protein [Bifidobacterium sp. 64T4]|uniref:acyltransferase family protein n=1 Tax=Bifidobacterium pongonis TaxID=2834432 RepID=UPI001C5A0739|nr:acyltransferase family protein [Bifidobacterium pongonis]MBW3095523.1 acyltransferase family protein [Bifidobacterium pongonis]